ncbi:hypothetical protein [Actinomadura sp. KC06]|uniref:hypothetical protein n=1 Tax=Actinomadura sp. KC06 TaxID=2530369 RepID=UPI0014055FB8|nr:hypothetical protein [Actinomadura sp. KC06]
MIGGLILLLCAVACGKGEEASLATTPLPMQPSGLAVGGDVQPQATDLAQTRISKAQLQEIAAACREAVEITDAGGDPCARSIREQFKNQRPCRPDSPCMIARETSHNPAGIVEIKDSSMCAGGEGNVCLRVGVKTRTEFFDVAATKPPGASPGGESPPGESTSPGGESPTPEGPSGETEITPEPQPDSPGDGPPDEDGPGPGGT